MRRGGRHPHNHRGLSHPTWGSRAPQQDQRQIGVLPTSVGWFPARWRYRGTSMTAAGPLEESCLRLFPPAAEPLRLHRRQPTCLRVVSTDLASYRPSDRSLRMASHDHQGGGTFPGLQGSTNSSVIHVHRPTRRQNLGAFWEDQPAQNRAQKPREARCPGVFVRTWSARAPLRQPPRESRPRPPQDRHTWAVRACHSDGLQRAVTPASGGRPRSTSPSDLRRLP